MQEREWLACDDPAAMLAHLGVDHHWGWVEQSPGCWVRGRKKSKLDRKLRLFAVACARRVWELIADEAGRKAVEAAEQYADGEMSKSALEKALVAGARCHLEDEEISDRQEYLRNYALTSALNAAGQPCNPLGAAGCAAEASGNEAAEKRAQSWLLRDVVGDPFRPPPALDPAWLAWNDATAVNLAQSVYLGRGFDQLPILADALGEASCADANLLGHLRGQGPHVRGCWALDLILGKT